MASRRQRLRVFALALASALLLALDVRAADDQPAAGVTVPAAALRELAELRRLTGCPGAPTDDGGREFTFRGRPSLEIKGWPRSGEVSGTVRDGAVFDPAAGRIVSYSCFTNASTRASGEPIVSLAAVSSRADALARAFFPGSSLGLESVERHRTDGAESIYYEARYTATGGEFPFLESPVQLLLNATDGSFFRLDIDADWLRPPDVPRVRISRKAAERIATLVLRRHDFAVTFGPGALFVKVAPAEMFTVHPNEIRGLSAADVEARARIAWVVPFRVDGGVAAGIHSLFVDAATGRILGGAFGQKSGPAPR